MKMKIKKENYDVDKLQQDILINFFDNCYKRFRFENYDQWINIGIAIKNKL